VKDKISNYHTTLANSSVSLNIFRRPPGKA